MPSLLPGQTVPMFKSVYYDRRSGSVKMRFVGDVDSEIPANKTYWVGSGNTDYYGWRDVYGNKVCRKSQQKKTDGIEQSEADIPVEIRTLVDLYQNQDDTNIAYEDFRTAYIDIEVEQEDIDGKPAPFPEPSVAAQRVNLITLYDNREKSFISFGLEQDCTLSLADAGIPDGIKWYYIKCQDEVTLFRKFIAMMARLRPDILTGWNSLEFDMGYLYHRALRLGLEEEFCAISPYGGVRKVDYPYDSKLSYKKWHIKIDGISQLDYNVLYRKYTVEKRINYKLDTIARIHLGEGKVELHEGLRKEYKIDWNNFVKYNIKDVDLVVGIDRETQLIRQVISSCATCRCPLEWNTTTKKMVVGSFLHFLHKRKIVMPPLLDHPKGKKFTGAYTRANPGRRKNVVSYDFKALYPSIMIGCNISPETKVIDRLLHEGKRGFDHTLYRAEDLIKSTIEGVYWLRGKNGIMADFTKYMFDTRDVYKQKKLEYKKLNDHHNVLIADTIQMTFKIFGNSIYGLAANRHFQFFDYENAASVANIGNNLIQFFTRKITEFFDNDLEVNEEFRKEFGSYANVTIKGDNPDWEKDIWSKNGHRRDRCTGHKRLVLIDTDSFFLDYSDIYGPFEKDMTLTDFTDRFEKAIFGEVRKKISEEWCQIYNWKYNTLYAKIEKCSNTMIVQTTKKYMTYLESDEGVWLADRPFEDRFKAVGIELQRTSTPELAKKEIMKFVKPVLLGADREEMLDIFKNTKLEYESADISQMSMSASCRCLYLEDKLEEEKEGEELVAIEGSVINWEEEGDDEGNSKAWDKIKVRPDRLAAARWNALLGANKDPEIITPAAFDTDKMNNGNFEPIQAKNRFKWVYINQKANAYDWGSIAFSSSKYPGNLNDIFEVDRDKMFEATYLKPIDRLTKAIGWGSFNATETESVDDMFVF